MAADQHDISIRGRKMMDITGVASVESCDVHEITLTTQAGPMQIQGTGLHMKRLDLANGIVEIEGTLVSIAYIADKKRKPSLIRRIAR